MERNLRDHPQISAENADSNQREVIIEINNLTVAYQNILALYDVNIDIHRGEYIGITGPNASGKTTLLKSILGLVKPLNGQIKIFNRDILKKNLSKTQKFKIAYVPQSTSVDRNFPALVEEH